MKKLIIVTGACGGIGSELIKRIVHERKFQCCVFVRNAEKLLKIVGDDCFRKIATVVHDFEIVSDDWKNDVESFIQSGIQEITLVLAACTIAPISRVGNLTQEQIQKNIMTNVMSQVLVVQHLAACCKKKDLPLRIVQLDSGAAYRPICGWALYCASKAYMSMFLKILNAEKDAHVVLYDPGVVDTDMQRQIRTAAQKDFPDVERFRRYFTEGELRSPTSVACEIYERYLLNWPKEKET